MSLLPFDDRDGWIWLNGEMLPWKEAKTHVLTNALHYGNAVFEGERAYNGKIFKSKEHSERLIRSAKILNMKIPFSAKQICQAKEELRLKNNLKNCYIRTLAFLRADKMGLDSDGIRTDMMIAAWEWPSYFSEEKREKGLNIRTEKYWRKPAPNTAPTASKAAGLYMVNTLVKTAATKAGFDDALMLDYKGQVAELSSANIFMVKNNKIYTPIPDCFLNGITRLTIIDIAKEKGYEVEETIILPEDLHNADEIFATGTAAEIAAIGKIDEHKYQVGSITRELRESYENLVRYN